jgi:hypothetical protein
VIPNKKELDKNIFREVARFDKYSLSFGGNLPEPLARFKTTCNHRVDDKIATMAILLPYAQFTIVLSEPLRWRLQFLVPWRAK